ncbi:hypothetical protein, partial [Pseudomonas syringae group genomosp. 7]|uniref:hypothetical protein n=1 Tax=Pseudomonas syringae group genomosp. 7 TaxID=251699 RepID=UPI00376FDFFD
MFKVECERAPGPRKWGGGKGEDKKQEKNGAGYYDGVIVGGKKTEAPGTRARHGRGQGGVERR